MSIAENLITAALSAAAGGGAIGLWFQNKMKKVLERKIDDIVGDIADLVKLELPQIDEIKKNVGIFIDAGVNKIGKHVETGAAAIEAAKQAKPKRAAKPMGSGRSYNT